MGKNNFRSQEAVDKEAVHKRKHVVVVHKSNEGACKEKESKEFATKSEIKTKLAVEKVKKEIAAKEAKSKVVVVVKKPCSPESSLEAYVKKGKATVIGEKDIKEAKAKAKMRAEEVQCSLARDICRKIYHYSSVHDDKIKAMVADHTKQLEVAWNKATAYSADKAAKTQFKICESAASDMKYFAHTFLKQGGTGQDGALVDFKMEQ